MHYIIYTYIYIATSSCCIFFNISCINFIFKFSIKYGCVIYVSPLKMIFKNTLMTYVIEKSSNYYVRSILCINLLSWYRMILTFHQSISFEPLAFLVIGYHQTEYFIIWMIWKGLVLNKYLKYIPWMYKLYKKSLISLLAMKHYYIIFTYFVMIVNKYDNIKYVEL